jgi:group I intron endonuclease
MTAPTTTGWLIYLATNTVNGHRYIGLTSRWRERPNEHFRIARQGVRWPFQAAIRKYGREAFTFSVLQTCHSRAAACKAEISLIASTKPEYNASKGGDGLSYWTGKKRSPETKAKISATKKGQKNPSAIQTMLVHGSKVRAASNQARQRPVLCLSDGLHFSSAREAARHYGSHRGSVTQAIRRGWRLFDKRFVYDGAHP